MAELLNARLHGAIEPMTGIGQRLLATCAVVDVRAIGRRVRQAERQYQNWMGDSAGGAEPQPQPQPRYSLDSKRASSAE